MSPIDGLIRSRRTHKAFGSQPVPRETLLELFELARWAPNHHLTDPWRFRVLGPESHAALKAAAEELDHGLLNDKPGLELPTLEGAGGYAREMTEDRSAKQRELLAPHVADADVLITTAAVPGRTAPAPPRWKMFVVTSIVIFALQLMLNLVLRQVASPIALVPRVALISFSVSAMMTWLVQPQLARLLESWLYAPRRSK